jgi:hypothetical protein
VMDAYTNLQPKDGEVIVHCGHIEGIHHWTFLKPPVKFIRPDGTTGETQWITECEKCFGKRGNTQNFQIRGDGTWKGDEPEIKVNPLVN